MKLWSMVLVVMMTFMSVNAEASKRMGGGKSVGQQSNNVTQRDTARAPAGPAQGAAAAPAAAGAAAAAPKRPWGAMLGGLAAGLGLAWLASSLGLGEAFGQMLMFGLLALAVMMVIGFVMRSRKAAQARGDTQQQGGLAMQGAGAGAASGGMPRSYNPDNVGNDASARPWERNNMAFDANRPANESGSMIGSAIPGSATASGVGGAQNWSVPADFDTAGFLSAAKANFVSLQDAWDRSDIAALRVMMTDAMLEEIKTQLADRETHTGTQPNKTEVVMLDAQLLGIEDLGQGYMASVEFSGMVREEPTAGPSAFREVWNMTKAKGGGGWLVAGVQALQ